MDDRPNQLYITNPKSKVTYRRGSFLGSGTFSSCYEFTTTTTKETFAGKVISKATLIKPHHKEDVDQEILIQRGLFHKFVVPLYSNFEDESNIYLILELCRKRSLMEMILVRKTLTVPEVRYFMKQIVLACKYIHDNKVIHRDLTLCNIFINDNMEIKVGDFGVASRLAYDGERKMRFCGTPAYMAPEILTNQGYSYEVDIWSIGCGMYHLLVGNSPFETNSPEDTYSKIKKCDYFLSPSLDKSARLLIAKLLNPDPDRRPNTNTILKDDFLTCGYIPSHLPVSCLIMKPRFSHNMLTYYNLKKSIPKKVLAVAVAEIENDFRKVNEVYKNQITMPKDFYLKELLQMLNVIVCNPETKFMGHSEYAEDPSAIPLVWIKVLKEIKLGSTYGTCYLLCDNRIGALFNDKTHLTLLQDNESLQYIDQNNKERHYTMKIYPPLIGFKVQTLTDFKKIVDEEPAMTAVAARPNNLDELACVPHLRYYFIKKGVWFFHFTNGTIQLNFILDYTVIILCPLLKAVSFFDKNGLLTVYKLELIAKYGCSHELAAKLRFSTTLIEDMYENLITSEKELLIK